MKLAILSNLGFRQRGLDESDGERMYFQVTKEFSGPRIHTRPPEPWNANIIAIVRQLKRNGYTHLALISYSHGQAASQAAAREAHRLEMSVPLWLACDPVYRAKWLPRSNWVQPFSIRALLKEGQIQVEPNIQRVVYCRQELNRPNGHTLIKTPGSATHITYPIVLQYRHNQIDGAPEWFEIVHRELTALTRPLTNRCNPPSAPTPSSFSSSSPKAIPVPE
jgi:hypothetical protein